MRQIHIQILKIKPRILSLSSVPSLLHVELRHFKILAIVTSSYTFDGGDNFFTLCT